MNEAREPRVNMFALCMCCGTISSSMLREVIKGGQGSVQHTTRKSIKDGINCFKYAAPAEKQNGARNLRNKLPKIKNEKEDGNNATT